MSNHEWSFAYQRHLIVGPITIALLWWFAALMWLHHRVFKGKTPKPVKLIAAPFVVADVLYNWTVGTFLFMERPREFLFTTRLHRHKKAGSEHAAILCKILNEHDPGHC